METQTREKAKLEIGKEYEIELYPWEKQRKGKYLGNSEELHFFKFEENNIRSYIIMRNRWLIKNENALSYSPFSSGPVFNFTENELKNIPSSASSFTNEVRVCLENLGEKF